MNKYTALTHQLFTILGFITQSTSLEAIVTEKDFRDSLVSDYPKSEVSIFLRNMPDLFVLHRIIDPVKSALFIRILSESEELNQEAFRIYSQYFPKELALLRYSSGKSKLLNVTIRWFKDGKINEEPLYAFLDHHGFGIIPPDVMQKLSQLGLNVQ